MMERLRALIARIRSEGSQERVAPGGTLMVRVPPHAAQEVREMVERGMIPKRAMVLRDAAMWLLDPERRGDEG